MDSNTAAHFLEALTAAVRLPLRYAGPVDIVGIQNLEIRAGALFRDIGLHSIADDEPPSSQTLLNACAQRQIVVVEKPRSPSTDNDTSRLIAWIWVTAADGDLFVEQLSIDPSHRGHRIGSSLLLGTVDHASRSGRPGVVLTTFADVPWNGPLYRRLGFEDMARSDMGPELREIRRRETEAGLDVLPRVCLRRRTSPGLDVPAGSLAPGLVE